MFRRKKQKTLNRFVSLIIVLFILLFSPTIFAVLELEICGGAPGGICPGDANSYGNHGDDYGGRPDLSQDTYTKPSFGDTPSDTYTPQPNFRHFFSHQDSLSQMRERGLQLKKEAEVSLKKDIIQKFDRQQLNNFFGHVPPSLNKQTELQQSQSSDIGNANAEENNSDLTGLAERMEARGKAMREEMFKNVVSRIHNIEDYRENFKSNEAKSTQPEQFEFGKTDYEPPNFEDTRQYEQSILETSNLGQQQNDMGHGPHAITNDPEPIKLPKIFLEATNEYFSKNKDFEQFKSDSEQKARQLSDFKELNNKWDEKEKIIQERIESKNIAFVDQELAKTEKEVVEFVKELALQEELMPEVLQDVVDELTEEEFVGKNLEKLGEYYEGKTFAAEELVEVLSGKMPAKDESGNIQFIKPTENTEKISVLNIDGDSNINAIKEQIKQERRELIADAGELLISFIPVAGPPISVAFSQLIKGEFDAEALLEGFAWGAADFAGVGFLKKIKNIGKAAGLIPKVVRLVEEGKEISKVKVVKIEEHHFLTDKHKTFFTKKFEDIVDKYGLKLDAEWNKEFMEHCGRHATEYHKWALEEVKEIAKRTKGNTEKFLELFEKNIASEVRAKPEMLKKEYWIKLNQGGPK